MVFGSSCVVAKPAAPLTAGLCSADRTAEDIATVRSLLECQADAPSADEVRASMEAVIHYASQHVPLWRNGCTFQFDREVIRARFEETISDPDLAVRDVVSHFTTEPSRYLRGVYQVFRSGGRFGDLAYFLYDRSAWQQFCADFLRHLRQCGISPDAAIAFVGTSDKRHTLARVAKMLPEGQGTTLGLQDGSLELVEGLNLAKPDVLCGFASVVEWLAKEQLTGRLSINPRGVFTNTDKATKRTRRLVQEAWGRSLYELVTSTEGGVLAFECASGKMHLNTRSACIESRPDSTRLLTNLVNRAQPIIRYAFPITMTLEGSSCSCGSGFPVVQIHGGRTRAMLQIRTDNGVGWLHPIVLRSALDGLFGVDACAFEATKDGALMLTVEGHAAPDDVNVAVRDGLQRAKLYGAHVKLTCRKV